MSRIIAFGASHGGVQALRAVIAGLGSDFPAPIVIVLHIGASHSFLPSILSDVNGLAATFARHGEKIQPGRIYVAPPDHHLEVKTGELIVSHGPRENWARPAIDPLFRSVAHAYGSEAIGVVLTGHLNDGTAGLYEIKRQKGIAVVQTPSTAEAPSMPRSALESVSVDYCLPVEEMPRLLKRLVREPPETRGFNDDRFFAMEHEKKIEEPVALTCPECGGAMRKEVRGPIAQLRCHIGHTYTAEIVAAAQVKILDDAASRLRRLLNKRVSLCTEMSEKHSAAGQADVALAWRRAAEQAAERGRNAKTLTDQEWLQPEAR